MSELKAGVIVTPHDEGMCFNRDSDVIAVTERETEFYLKSEADKVIAKLKEAQRWREFIEEKPKHHQRILVCSRDYKTELRRWDEGCKFDVETQEIYTHWMPLPKEPEDFT